MSDNNIGRIIAPYLERIQISLTDDHIDRLNALASAMLADPLYKSVSKILDLEEMALKHFLDSIAPMTFRLPVWKSRTIVDLGTGGGFPCLPLAVLLPESRFIAVDARQKSVEFVARMAEAVGLTNVSVKHSRIEDLGRDPLFREKADLVVCRALSSVRTLVEYAIPLVKTGGWTFFYKGPKLEEELSESVNAFLALEINEGDVEIYHLNDSELPFERNFVAIKKSRPVSDRYPRKCGIPASKPL